MTFKGIFASVLFSALVTGCASSVSLMDEAKSDGLKAVEQAKQFAVTERELQHVRYTNDFYVPALEQKDQDMPGWFFEVSEGSYLDYTLEEVMRDELARRGVNIRYLDSLDKSRRFSLSHNGTVGGLLDKISFATKYSYQIEGDLLTWSKFKVEEFDVSFIAGQTEYLFGSKENESGSGGRGGMGGAMNTVVSDSGFADSDEYINFSTKGLSVWDDIRKAIELLKSKEGSYVINQATSTVMIKDFPDNVLNIEQYIESENKKLTRMVAVDLQIVEFTANEGSQRGINWSVIKQDLATGGVFGLQSAFDTLNTNELAPTILGYSQETGKYAGSQVLLNILDKHGVVSSVKHRRVVSLNNQVSKLVEGGEIGYLAQSGGTATANVGSQENLMPGILKTGDAIYMLPNAVNDHIIIQLSSKITRLDNLRQVTSGEKSIETPETTNSDIFLKFAVKDGETLLISGSSEERQEYTENSTGGLMILGGEYGGNNKTSETIVLITPRIVNS